MEQTLQAVTTTALPPLITAIMAALGIWLRERRRDRDEIHRRFRTVGKETAHLDYLKSWLEAVLVPLHRPAARAVGWGYRPNHMTAAPRTPASSWYPRVQAAPAHLAGEEGPGTFFPGAPQGVS